MLIDMTHTITPEIPVYPGDPAPVLAKAATLTKDGYRSTSLQFCSHTGTHMDAPAHLLQDGRTLDDMPMSQFSGRATVLDVSGEERAGMTVEDLLARFKAGTGTDLDNDRILLS